MYKVLWFFLLSVIEEALIIVDLYLDSEECF